MELKGGNKKIRLNLSNVYIYFQPKWLSSGQQLKHMYLILNNKYQKVKNVLTILKKIGQNIQILFWTSLLYQRMSATSVERISSTNHFADLRLTRIEPPTLVTGLSNSTDFRISRSPWAEHALCNGIRTKLWIYFGKCFPF